MDFEYFIWRDVLGKKRDQREYNEIALSDTSKDDIKEQIEMFMEENQITISLTRNTFWMQ